MQSLVADRMFTRRFADRFNQFDEFHLFLFFLDPIFSCFHILSHSLASGVCVCVYVHKHTIDCECK